MPDWAAASIHHLPVPCNVLQGSVHAEGTGGTAPTERKVDQAVLPNAETLPVEDSQRPKKHVACRQP